jgi:glycosyltransferase involved in cell wall biosynthesis
VDVALVITTLMVGGAERFVVRLANELCPSLRVEIWILCGYEPRPLQAAVDDRVRVRLNVDLESQAGRILWTTRLLRAERPRIVQSFLWEADFVCAVAARFAGHSDLFVSERGDRWATRWQQRLLDRLAVFPTARAVIANSSAAAEKLVASGWRRDINVIHNGLPPVRVGRPAGEVRASLGLEPGTPVVGMVARMVTEKGWLDLVEASIAVRRRHPRAAFVAVGDGPHLDLVQKAAVETSMTAAWRFVGRVENPADYIQLFDVACLPSMREACPNVILEYLAMGRAVVASRAGGIPELAQGDGLCAGVLIDPGDADRLGEEISRLLTDPDARGKLEDHARRRSQRFTIGNVAREYVDTWGLSGSGVPGSG